ncbi:MBL fold metallo-hydrolase [Elizabethkingia anophelis]|uniref:MBL fold metallo-hydrolase n=1 Tax=Elizabethkingia anophelis TaxID=1117645 RepID=UPI0016246895|nr:MBL fold metallo-hydrolase [Elizabethkingia anophelis]MCT4323257.1 MBL fold metallo-hydrolase [Elizabethkingia anophelis]HAY3537027.1 MBL fold metallo-hydrolase [Elizabethkingia anophelis]HAY3549144.1 MBL fold metallo-hydrolase [Elizabethkingia anophelis]HAY3593909.1 MBL fold metallo-hydrolase [Elizabethkingia anophelis]
MKHILSVLCLLAVSFWLQLYNAQTPDTYVEVLGVAQDGGFPHMGCNKEGCNLAWEHPELRRNVSSLALVDPVQKKWWLFDATPDIRRQLHDFSQRHNREYPYLPEGVFITHAHIGHYTGLMEFGKEVMNTKQVKVYVLPKLKNFLESNGPWSQLVGLKNIEIIPLTAEQEVSIGNSLTVKAFTVPHRDEYSETAGFRMLTPKKKFLFIPDIDKWSKWNKNITEEVKNVDYAFLDATFYDQNEMGNRPVSEVPHPLVTETEDLFQKESSAVKKKIHFIHFNHSNRILWDKAIQGKVRDKGFNIAEEGKQY